MNCIHAQHNKQWQLKIFTNQLHSLISVLLKIESKFKKMTKALKLTKEQKAYIKKQADKADKSIFHIDPVGLSDYIKNGETLVFFGAHWCKFTQMLTPQWLQFQQWYHQNNSMHSVRICKVECGDADEICANYFSVEEFPTIIHYKNGRKVEEYTGEENAAHLYHYMRMLTSTVNGYPSLPISQSPKASQTLSITSYPSSTISKKPTKKKYIISKSNTHKSRLQYHPPAKQRLIHKDNKNHTLNSTKSNPKEAIPLENEFVFSDHLDRSVEAKDVERNDFLNSNSMETILLFICLLIILYFMMKRLKLVRWIRMRIFNSFKRSHS